MNRAVPAGGVRAARAQAAHRRRRRRARVAGTGRL